MRLKVVHPAERAEMLFLRARALQTNQSSYGRHIMLFDDLGFTTETQIIALRAFQSFQ
jgi:hypothetical protein